ncbi:MAG: hypothetical protein LBC68_11515 [Prevotellaceae bacterium]|jgi:hypothetical protein|nr:hypothetical protein [Prevotellaceae bacterium]
MAKDSKKMSRMDDKHHVIESEAKQSRPQNDTYHLTKRYVSLNKKERIVLRNEAVRFWSVLWQKSVITLFGAAKGTTPNWAKPNLTGFSQFPYENEI